MKKSAAAAHILLFMLLAGACGGGEGGSSGDGDGDGVGDGDALLDGDSASGGAQAGDGDAASGGDAAGDGDAASGGDAAGDGDGDSAGGAGGAGGAATGGAPATGGNESTGGEPNGTGGLPGICGCDAVSVPVCGVDGNNYDAGCGDECVPVDIECQGVCPCEGCGCEVMGDCQAGQRQWLCTGNSYSDAAFLAEGCESVPVGSIRYCCAVDVVPADFCQ